MRVYQVQKSSRVWAYDDALPLRSWQLRTGLPRPRPPPGRGAARAFIYMILS